MDYDTAMNLLPSHLITLAQEAAPLSESLSDAGASINTVFDVLPTASLIASGVALLVGLVLWLIGRKIARPACAVGGLVAGSALGFVGSQQLLGGQSVILLMIGAAVITAILAYVLFRVWMGISLALLLALLAPIAGLAWRGDVATVEPPTVSELLIPDSQIESDGDGGDADADAEGEASLGEHLREVYGWYQSELTAWWSSLGATGRTMVMGASAVGALVGMIFGLLMPYFAATVQTATVGGGLILLAAWPQLPRFAPELAESLPPTTRSMVLALGLITALGVVLQWTLFGRKSDD